MTQRNYMLGQRNHGQRSYYSRRRMRRLINMTNNARNSRLINNVNTIVRIPTPQITSNYLENTLFNGTNFDNN